MLGVCSTEVAPSLELARNHCESGEHPDASAVSACSTDALRPKELSPAVSAINSTRAGDLSEILMLPGSC